MVQVIARSDARATMSIKGPPLEEGIPEKIKKIKAKGYTIIGEDEIKNLREERNRAINFPAF
jgi:hypothetical protein